MAFFSNQFPWTNIHNINLDWIINRIKNVVKSVNYQTPDDAGNVTLLARQIGAVERVNMITPDAIGNVDVGTVRTVNGQSPDSSGAVTVPAVKTVNNISPDSAGNVNVGTVKKVNNTSPDSAGNVNVGTVKSVNNTTPDSAGNVNLPTVAGVTSVAGIGADGTGNVPLTATDLGAVTKVNNILPDNDGNVQVPIPEPSIDTPSALGTASPGSAQQFSRGDHVHPLPSTLQGIHFVTAQISGNSSIDVNISGTSAGVFWISGQALNRMGRGIWSSNANSATLTSLTPVDGTNLSVTDGSGKFTITNANTVLVRVLIICFNGSMPTIS